MSELKPCPFCGSDDVFHGMLEEVHYVKCCDCCAKVESNTRAIDRDELMAIADELENKFFVVYDSHGEIDHADCFVERIMKAIGE